MSLVFKDDDASFDKIQCFVCNVEYPGETDVPFHQMNKMEKYTGLVPLELLKHSVQELEINADDNDMMCDRCFILLRQFYQFYKEILRVANFFRIQLYKKYNISEIDEDEPDVNRLRMCGRCEYSTTNKGLLRLHQKFHTDLYCQQLQQEDESSDESSQDEVDKLDNDTCYVLTQVGRLERMLMQIEPDQEEEQSEQEGEEKDLAEFKTIINGIKYTCTRCYMTSEGWKEHYNHMDKVHKAFTTIDHRLDSDDTPKCNYCGVEFSSMKDKAKHLRAHKQAIRKRRVRAFYRAIKMRNPAHKPFTTVEKEMYGIRQSFDCVNCKVKFKKQIDVIK